jgi:type I restriction enzyme M protein
MTFENDLPATLRTLRATLNLTQEQLGERLGVSFATVNRWEGGLSKPQKAAAAAIQALAVESGIATDELSAQAAAVEVSRRRARSPKSGDQALTTKPMEQMLWDAACSIRGEKDAAKFKDYLLPLVFLKRLSDVFDDEVNRLAEDYGDKATALEIAEADHSLLRFYLPPEARWGVISGREAFDWPLDDKKRSTAPKDAGEHLTRALRGVVKHNPSLSGVIDVVDFAAERNGERDINPAKLREVIETFSDPRYRLGLADVQPDFLGRAYEYLLRKFAEGSGQSAGEFFTPTEAGFLMAHLLRPRPGETCHDFACGSGGLLIKLQLVSRELDPMAKVPLKLYGQELEGASYAVAHMNAKIHDMDMALARGNSMLNPKFRTPDGRIQAFDIVIANPMWNQPFDADTTFANDPYDRFRTAGGITSGKGDWAWLQHTLACLNNHGRAAVVLDTGAVTRGSGSKNEDKERNIRKWFVEQDLIDGVILLPDNLFYNTTAAGIIVLLNKRKPASRQGRIVLLNASKRFKKGKPKNYLPEDAIRPLAAMYLKGEAVEGELAVITQKQAAEADYNLSPRRWVDQSADIEHRSISGLLADLSRLATAADARWTKLLLGESRDYQQQETSIGPIPVKWQPKAIPELCQIQSGGTPSKSNAAYWQGEIPWISGKDLKRPSLDDGQDHVTPEAIDAASRLAPKGSVLLLVRGMGLAKDLPVAVINRDMAFNQDIKALVPKGSYSGGFIRAAIYAGKDRLLSQIVPSAHGTMTLNQSDVESFQIPCPDEPKEAEAIANVVDLISKRIELHREMQSVLEELFQALLHKLMTGEIDVNDLDLSALQPAT